VTTSSDTTLNRRLHRSRALVRNLPAIASIGLRHLADDPMQSAVLATRLLPSRARLVGARLAGVSRGSEAPATSAASATLPGRWPVLRALALWDRGRRDEALQVLRRAAAPGAPPRRVLRCAGLALAFDRPETAERILAEAPAGHPRRRRMEALLAAREGRLTEAAQLLAAGSAATATTAGAAGAAGPGPRGLAARHNRRRIEGELTVLRGAVLASKPASPGPAASGRPAPRRAPVPGRVLHLVTNSLPYKPAGYTVRTHEIALAQQRIGLDPQVVTRFGFPVQQGVFAAADIDVVDGVPYHRLLPRGPFPWPADRAVAANVEHAAALVERLRPAVLHAATMHVNGQVAVALRERYGLPVVYEVRGFLEETWLSRHADGGLGSERYELAREAETDCMRRADLVVTLGETMKAEIAARGVPADRILVVPNAVEDAFLAPLPDRGPVRDRLGLPADAVVIGLISTFVGYEGIDVLLRAGRVLLDKGAPVRLLLVGDGADRSALEQLADDLGIRAATTFTGRVPFAAVREYYSALDIFVTPRLDVRVAHMVTPLKPMEAMGSGLPLVASDVRALAEVVEPGKTGLLAPPGDPDALADALATLVYDSDLRRRLGQAGREWVSRDRTWSRNAQRYRDAYLALGAATSTQPPTR
jgi:glycosyltransferase involved in cell wall biosynthesis